jgi:hypothetical protein
MTKIHCNGCDEVIQNFHSRLRFYAAICKGDKEVSNAEDPIDVCAACVANNPLLRRLDEGMQPESGRKK